MKHLLSIAFIIAVISGTASAQVEWKNYSRTAELEINYSYAECHDNANGIHKSMVLLQFVNLTDKHLSVTYRKQAWYNGQCRGCDDLPENLTGIRLAPGQTLTGTCDDRKLKGLSVFDKMLDVKASYLEKFELADIQITTVQ